MKRDRKKHSIICVLTHDPNLIWFARRQAESHSVTLRISETLQSFEKNIESNASALSMAFLDADALSEPSGCGSLLSKINTICPNAVLLIITSSSELAEQLRNVPFEHVFLRPYLFEELQEVTSKILKNISPGKIPKKLKQSPVGNVLQAKILIVDDETEVCEFIRDFLDESEEGHFEVRFAHEPEAAIRLCREFEPDLAIVDLKLPQISGLELIERFKRLSGFKPKDYLIFTGSDSPEERRRIEDRGIFHLSKSCDTEQFMQAISAICQKWRLTQKRAS